MSGKTQVPQFQPCFATPPPRCEEFARAADAWLAWLLHNRGRSPLTLEKYGGHLRRFALWFTDPPAAPHLRPQGDDPLRPTLDDLERYAGPVAHAAGIGPRARRPIVAALRGFFAWVSARAGVVSPAATLTPPRYGLRLPRAIPLRDAERLLMANDLETLAGLRDAAMFALLLGAGLRVGGLCALNESDLIWHHDEAGIDRLTLRAVEKGGRERFVPVATEAAMLLRAYLGHAELGPIGRQLQDGDAVVFVTLVNTSIPACDYHGEARRMTRRSVYQAMRRAAARAGIDERFAHPHALRHRWGAELAEDDAPILQHQALMGHADAKATAIYAHIAQRKLRQLVDQSNPLGKMRAPLLDSLRTIAKATAHPGPPSSSPPTSRNR